MNVQIPSISNIEYHTLCVMSHVTWSVQLARPDHHQLQEDEHWGHHLKITLGQLQSSSISKFQIHQLDPLPHLTVVKLADVLQLVAEQELEHKQQTCHGEREVNTDL